jgi:hypothetical protein
MGDEFGFDGRVKIEGSDGPKERPFDATIIHIAIAVAIIIICDVSGGYH